MADDSPTRRERWIRAFAGASLLSFLCGALDVAGWACANPERNWTWDVLKTVLPGTVGYVVVTFWILMAILYFAYVRKSAATLEYQERVRRDEDLLK